MAYVLILPLSKIISYRDLGCNLPPKSHLTTLCQVKLQIQQVKLPLEFISIYFKSKIFSVLFWPLVIYKGTTRIPFSFDSKQVSLARP